MKKKKKVSVPVFFIQITPYACHDRGISPQYVLLYNVTSFLCFFFFG